MGIARAIRRVKRQAKRGGLDAVMSGLGEGLRSRAVPAPLRGAARKIASLIDPTRAPAGFRSRTDEARASTGHPWPHASAQHARASSSQVDPGIARPPAEVTATGVDSGAEPRPAYDDTPVDAVTVGATPTYNATPLEVAPIDASPLEVTPSEVTAVEVSVHDLPSAAVEAELNEESELSTQAAVEGSPRTREAIEAKKGAAKKPSPAAPKLKPPEATKEKLAADGGAAKSVARSGSRTAKKPASARADTTSKKK